MDPSIFFFAVLGLYVIIVGLLILLDYFRGHPLHFVIARLRERLSLSWPKSLKISDLDLDVTQDYDKWQALEDLIPLIQLLPRDTWIQKKISTEGGFPRRYIIELTRPLQEEDILHCREFAGWVLSLGYHKADKISSSQPICCDVDKSRPYELMCTFELHAAVYDALQSLGVLPLPNLRTYCVRTEVEFATLNRVAGPMISGLDFASWGYQKASSSHLRPEILLLPVTLRVLNFDDSCLPSEISSSLMRSFQFMHELKEVSLPYCDILKENDFQELLSAKTIHKLNLGMMKSEYLHFVPLQSSQRLRHLGVSVNDLELSSELLGKMGSNGTSKLESLSVSWRIREGAEMSRPAPVLEEYFRKLPLLCNPDCLEVVNVCSHSDENPVSIDLHYFRQYPDYEVSLQTISPLFAFKRLRNVNIHFKWKDYNVSFMFNIEWKNKEMQERTVTIVTELDDPRVRGFGRKVITSLVMLKDGLPVNFICQ